MKSTFNAENFLSRLSRSIASYFKAIHFWFVSRLKKTLNPLFWGFKVVQGHLY